MTELIIALLMIVNGEIKEHRIQENMATCLRHKRIAERQYKENIQYKCVRSKANLEENIDCTKTIRSLILE